MEQESGGIKIIASRTRHEMDFYWKYIIKQHDKSKCLICGRWKRDQDGLIHLAAVVHCTHTVLACTIEPWRAHLVEA